MKISPRAGLALRLAAAVLTGILLDLGFPPVCETSAVWLAFIPLLLVAYVSSPRASFRLGWISGFVFWLLSLAWLLRLSDTGGPAWLVIPGWLLLSAYCALFTGFFLFLASALLGWARGTPDEGESQGRRMGVGGRFAALVMLPLFWVGLEYWRSTLLTGFPWNGLGISQFLNTPVIQLAEWGGVYVVSALIMLANVGLTLTALRIVDGCLGRRVARLNIELLVALIVMGLCGWYGVGRIREVVGRDGHRIVIGAVQPNIPQLKKWPAEFAYMVYDSLEQKTSAAMLTRPHLVVWPETSIPGLVPNDSGVMTFVRNLASQGAPILAGGIELSDRRGPSVLPADIRAGPAIPISRYFNSTFLFDTNGILAGRYRKQHLVPFGEYLPLDDRLAFVERLAPLGFICDAGPSSTVFRIEIEPRVADETAKHPSRISAAFGVLICFEDVFAYLARVAVRSGARFLVNQTNDAWFDGSSGSIQHLSHSVFRCVENRVPMVRSANTGVTCFIDSAGRIDRDTLALMRNGETHTVEYRTGELRIQEAGQPLTFYCRFGDWPLAAPAGILVMAALALAGWRQRKMRLATSASRSNSDTSHRGDEKPGV